jgi:hypothetical protein
VERWKESWQHLWWIRRKGGVFPPTVEQLVQLVHLILYKPKVCKKVERWRAGELESWRAGELGKRTTRGYVKKVKRTITKLHR